MTLSVLGSFYLLGSLSSSKMATDRVFSSLQCAVAKYCILNTVFSNSFGLLSASWQMREQIFRSCLYLDSIGSVFGLPKFF